MDQRIINLYDRFTHGGMTRRDFLDRLAELAGSVAAGAALLPLLQNNYAQAAIVADNDPRLAIDRVAYDSPKGKINAYLARFNPFGVVIAAILFGALILAGRQIQPAGIPAMIQGIVLFCVICSDILVRNRVLLVRR